MEKIEIQQISRQWVNDVMDVNEANAEDVFEESEDNASNPTQRADTRATCECGAVRGVTG